MFCGQAGTSRASTSTDKGLLGERSDGLEGSEQIIGRNDTALGALGWALVGLGAPLLAGSRPSSTRIWGLGPWMLVGHAMLVMERAAWRSYGGGLLACFWPRIGL